MLNNTPYKDVKWQDTQYVHGVTHDHLYPNRAAGTSQQTNTDRQMHYDSKYNRGIRHQPVSNYSPSSTMYPLDDYLIDIREGLSSPNAEHKGYSEHFNGLGSFFESDEDFTKGIYDAFSSIVDHFQYEDGGGITINHPYRSNTTVNKMIDYLDSNLWVLGVETYNYRAHRYYDERGWALDLCDKVLNTGRQCYGFFNPDLHSPWNDQTEGRSIVLVPEVTEREILKAYRQGNFFNAIHGSGLIFTKLNRNGNVIEVETNTGTEIRFVNGDGVSKRVQGKTATYTITQNDRFIRVEVDDKNNILPEGQYWYQNYETIYSQAFMLRTREDDKRKLRSLLML